MAHNNPYNLGKLGGNPSSSGVPPSVNPLLPNNEQLKALAAMQLAAQNSQNNVTPGSYPQLMAAATQQTGQSTSQQQQATMAASSPYLRGHPQLQGGLDQQMYQALMAQGMLNPNLPQIQNPLLAAQMVAATANIPPNLYGQFAAGSGPTPNMQDILSRNYLMQMMANPTSLLAQQMMDPSALGSSNAQMAAFMEMQRLMTLNQMYGLGAFPGTPSLDQLQNFTANPAAATNQQSAQASHHQNLLHQHQKSKQPMMLQRTPVPPTIRRTPPQQLHRRENSQSHPQQQQQKVKPSRNGSTGNVSSVTSQNNVSTSQQQQSHQRDSLVQRPDASRYIIYNFHSFRSYIVFKIN